MYDFVTHMLYKHAAALLLLLPLSPLQGALSPFQQLLQDNLAGAKMDGTQPTPTQQQLAAALAAAIKAKPESASHLAAAATAFQPSAAPLLAESAVFATVSLSSISEVKFKDVLRNVYELSEPAKTQDPVKLAGILSFHAARGAVANPSEDTKSKLQAVTAQSIISAYSWTLSEEQKATATPALLLTTIVVETVRGSGQPASTYGPAIMESAVYTAITNLGLGTLARETLQQAMSFDVKTFAENVAKELGLAPESAELGAIISAAGTGKEMAVRALASNVQTANLVVTTANQNAVVPGAVTPVVER